MVISETRMRLAPETRERAWRALTGEWGRALEMLPVTLDTEPDLEALSPVMRCARAVQLIAAHAPIRILPHQPIVGAATLRAATWHQVPVFLEGKPVFSSVSHLTAGFDHALAVGYRGLRAQIDERLARGDLAPEQVEFLQAMRLCLEAAGVWHRRYLEALDDRIAHSEGEERRRYEAVRAGLERVPEEPPTTFREAVQSLWMMFCFQRLCGNWPGIGRVDQMLGPYLRRDLDAGRITLDEARELLAAFWINGCDWVGAVEWGSGSGDGQYYQNVVLGGIGADGNEVTNEVTYLILDVVEELRIAEFPIAVRIGARTPERLLRRVAEVMRVGNGILAVYNEELVIRALVRFGYPEREARRFANDACWEVQIPGETCFGYWPFDVLQLLQEAIGVRGEGPIHDFPDFESLYAAFRARLAAYMEEFHRIADGHGAGNHVPTPLISLLVKDCIERGRGYYDRGARYNVLAPHPGGIPDTGNCLVAIKRLVYDERRMTYPELAALLRANWEGFEPLRRQVLAESPRYGNDDPEADAMTKRVLDDFLVEAERVRERNGVLRPAGVSTFGREITWRGERGATADGHLAGEILATNFSPTPGSDRKGPTAVIRSLCAMDLVRLPNGTALELKVLPTSVEGETGLAALVALLRSFVALGGFFMQVDVVSSELLRAAQAHPEQYANLAVRVSGWSARFVTLTAEWQAMIIQRTEQAAAR